MGRPPLPLGTYGQIRHYRQTDGNWNARTLFRDYDGVTRPVYRQGRTKAGAERRLVECLRDRVRIVSGADVTPDTRVDALAEAWLEEIRSNSPSPNTLTIYRGTLDRHVIPALGRLRVRELTVSLLDKHLKALATKSGSGTARTARSVLSGMCGMATRHDAMERNPIREVAKITAPKKPQGKVRALTVAESKQLRALLTYDEKAVARDLPDLVGMMAATGMRIGEASAVTWEALDLEAATVEVRGTVIRTKGVDGLYIKPEPKTKAGYRTLRIPSWAVAMLRERRKRVQDVAPDTPVFLTPRGRLRDPSNTQADLREAFEAAGFDWATSRVFRRTVATMMDDAGLSGRQAADQLGHANPSMTTDVYMGRNRIADTAAPVLEQLG
jgi:integrase